ncbi:hypothetical protein ACFLWC_04845 [Chloroflexota bacterium]
MAKEDMTCPFSGKLCGDCALYRGRHYYLCFSKKYQGNLEKSGGDARNSILFKGTEMPSFCEAGHSPTRISP